MIGHYCSACFPHEHKYPAACSFVNKRGEYDIVARTGHEKTYSRGIVISRSRPNQMNATIAVPAILATCDKTMRNDSVSMFASQFRSIVESTKKNTITHRKGTTRPLPAAMQLEYADSLPPVVLGLLFRLTCVKTITSGTRRKAMRGNRLRDGRNARQQMVIPARTLAISRSLFHVMY